MNAFFVICGLGVFSLLAEVFNLKKWTTLVSIVGLAVASYLVYMQWAATSYHYHGMVYFDHFALAFSALIFVTAIFWFLMSRSYFADPEHRSDKSALVLFVVIGAILMVSFNNMAILFLGVEILSISLYVLAGSNKQSLFSTEAAFKYFLMGSFATGFLLFGMTLVYGTTGSFSLTAIADFIVSRPPIPRYFFIGMLLMMIGLAFKISAVPFHQWAPDVYEGSPTPITALMSTVVKIAAFGAFIKIFSVAFGAYSNSLIIYQQGIMVLTLVVANVTAVYQTNVKRMLAYSSVGQVGYLLLGFSSNANAASGTIFYYLLSYVVASIMAFTVIQIVEKKKGNANIENFKGLLKSNPLLGVAMTIAMFSLAGIPPFAGFFGKYLVFNLAINNGFVWATVLAAITSLVGVYYYFKPIIAMSQSSDSVLAVDRTENLLLVVLIALNLAVGIFPSFFQVI
ncbi:MAG TPA: NADH-quinone oxidoreductase subunit N [Cytophagales bacterium]|jgi:NADH-quinone oxidoreductase subunit N|nr:NADH-quinone oxidoreductase subunit N [Cytophagales bacterium]